MKDARERKLKSENKEPDQYTFDYEPIRGYPELRWTGKRPFRGTSYYPAQRKESFGDSVDGWLNKLYWGDNLQVMSHLLREYRGKVRLIYIDPPFDSKADYKKKIELRGARIENDASAFEEKQYSDIWINDEYLQFMYERLILMRELLAEDGSIYVHMDEKRSHPIKLIMDEVFGTAKFRREIIWDTQVLSGYKTVAQNWIHGHDCILYFSKEKPIFNKQRQPHRKEYLDRFDKVDSDGRAFFDGRGEKRYLDEAIAEGKAVGDVWYDIMSFQQIPTAVERNGYPTQKPEALLERIIKASSNPGDLVFDCFMGSGTTQAVAMKLGRRFLGADINLGAIQTTTKRLLGIQSELKTGNLEFTLGDAEKPPKIYSGFEVYTVNNYDFFRNELEAKRLLIEALEIQELPGNMLWDGEKDGWMVKILAVNRLATAADLESVLSNLDYKAWEKRAKEHPERPVERIKFVCLGHDPDLRSQFLEEMEKLGFKVEVEVLDVLRDKKELQFKRESEAKLAIAKGKLEIKRFYPMNLLQKLSLEKTKVGEWRELVDSILVDWNYDGVLFRPTVADIPEKNELVKGVYDVPDGAGRVRVKITDLLSESWEGEVEA